MSWSHGYLTEHEYTFGYYKELSPSFQRFVALMGGYDVPESSDDDVHMELGIGNGISVNIHAASNRGHFIGNDFNPSHALYAQKVGNASGASISLTDESFEQLAKRTDLPMCSSISLHGIWSWISDENRAYIVDIINRCLKPGGLVYNSYNVNCGNAHFKPWRDMMYNFYQTQTGTPMERLEATLAHFSQIFEQQPHFFEDDKALKSTWDRIQIANRAYLLHEYFNNSWDCFYITDVAKQFEDAKLKFIGSTTNNHHLNHINLSPVVLQQVHAQPNIVMSEAWRDALIKNTFRRDLYIKGGAILNQRQILNRLRKRKFMLATPSDNFGNYLTNLKDSRSFNVDLFEGVKNVFVANDFAPVTFAQLADAVQEKYNWVSVLQLLLFKIEHNEIAVCLDEVSEQSLQQSQNLNQYFLSLLDESTTNLYLANPITGCGIAFDFVSAGILRAWSEQPDASDEELAEAVWQYLLRNERVLVDAEGNSMASKDDNIASLLKSVENLRPRLPWLKQLCLLPEISKIKDKQVAAV